ncbi:unnamed protein product [Sphagnum jensenii]|uniref:STI1 domain-containing protein n=1 Tax=Sphagnum jensenii TaxID=128206 RepID=A0ABP1BUF6_9BRYO
MGFSDFQQAQEQLLQDPNLDIIDHNPDLAHILNDPGTLGQTLDAARNPELMREMMRNTDRAMSNIEASPEGFNMLRRMYATVIQLVEMEGLLVLCSATQVEGGSVHIEGQSVRHQLELYQQQFAGVGLPNLGRLADHGLADLGSLDSAGGMLDPDTVQQMLQNPHIQQMMQGLLSNPQFMNQEMMQSPNFLCQISSPESLEIGVLIWLHI